MTSVDLSILIGDTVLIPSALFGSHVDHNLSAWNQYYRPSCMSYSIESQS